MPARSTASLTATCSACSRMTSSVLLSSSGWEAAWPGSVITWAKCRHYWRRVCGRRVRSRPAPGRRVGFAAPGGVVVHVGRSCRELGTAWTTLHLSFEREASEVLGLPEGVWQGVWCRWPTTGARASGPQFGNLSTRCFTMTDGDRPLARHRQRAAGLESPSPRRYDCAGGRICGATSA